MKNRFGWLTAAFMAAVPVLNLAAESGGEATVRALTQCVQRTYGETWPRIIIYGPASAGAYTWIPGVISFHEERTGQVTYSREGDFSGERHELDPKNPEMVALYQEAVAFSVAYYATTPSDGLSVPSMLDNVPKELRSLAEPTTPQTDTNARLLAMDLSAIHYWGEPLKVLAEISSCREVVGAPNEKKPREAIEKLEKLLPLWNRLFAVSVEVVPNIEKITGGAYTVASHFPRHSRELTELMVRTAQAWVASAEE